MTALPAAQIRGISRLTLAHLVLAIAYVALLAGPLLFFVYVKSVDLFPPCSIGDSECVGEKLEKQRFLATSTWGALISLAAAAGALGTILSFFLRMTKSDPINSNISSDSVIAYFIGAREILILSWFGSVFGLLMLSLFVGSFVQGELFPEVNGSFWMSIDLRVKSWAKMLIWCFIAGFSERLIPNLLDSLAKRVQEIPIEKNNEQKVVEHKDMV